jgi:hypothetical protein
MLLSFSADVWWGTTGHTLINSTPYSVNSTSKVRLKVPDVCYYSQNPLDNT